MYEVKVRFNEFPDSLKKGFLLLVMAWAWHFITITRYPFLSMEETLIKQIFIGVGICVAVFLVIAWGRILCMIFNSVIVIFYLLYTCIYIISGNMPVTFFVAINVILFSASTYYLAVKETSAFFKKHTRKLADKQAENIKTQMDQAEKRKEEIQKMKAQREEVKKRTKAKK